MSGTSGSGSPRARMLGAELREARNRKKFGTREIARKLEIPHVYISRWETGERLPKTEDVASLLTALGVNGADRDRLIEMARVAAEPNWVTAGFPDADEALAALIEFERTATRITDWSPLVIPGLLQTGDYARAVMSGIPSRELEALVTLRLARRDVLTRRDAVELHAILGEPALRQIIGGREVMAEQLRQLLRMAELPTVTLQAVPIGEGWHPGLAGPFVLLEFAKGRRPIVHLEHHRSSLFPWDEDDVDAYVDASTTVRQIAMSPADSTELIAELIKKIDGEMA